MKEYHLKQDRKRSSKRKVAGVEPRAMQLPLSVLGTLPDARGRVFLQALDQLRIRLTMTARGGTPSG